ncbi:MAG: methyltransferase domain-containing protein, partial [Deltaproteobacteria bacterium]|nr:methyltransferase domain-containing protein [Deltaproteobacteria bacterium]
SLHHGLRALGHDSVLTHGLEPLAGRRVIVLGANLLPKLQLALPGDALLYNLEQVEPGSPWFSPALVELFRRHRAWDYSALNAAQWERLGVARPTVVPIGWAPELARIPRAPSEDIDVLFYGSLNPRRQAVLDGLKAAGVKVETLFGVYGAERDAVIARAKLVLNLHYYDARVFEAVRVSYLLGNGRVVVSETGASREEEAAWEGAVAFAPYDTLVPTCLRLLADAPARAALGEAGRALMARRLAADALRPVLESLDAPAPAAVPSYYGHARPEVVARFDPAGLRVLDVGCAAGAMGALLLQKGAAEVVGLELDLQASRVARRRLTRVHRVDLSRLPHLPYPDGHFDAITCADVLEHLADPRPVLGHLRRYLKDDGLLVTSIPNVRHESVLVPLLVQGRFTYADAGVLDRTHLRFFTLTEYAAFLRDSGFEPLADVGAVGAQPSAAVQRLAQVVAELGGDAQRFTAEAAAVQFLVSARPARPLAALGLPASPVVPGPVEDAWAGSRPHRVLVSTAQAQPTAPWRALLPPLLANPGVTVGLALPLAQLATPPEGLEPLASDAPGELLLLEAPRTADAWARLLAGAAVYVDTGEVPALAGLAEEMGLEVVRAGSGGGRV